MTNTPAANSSAMAATPMILVNFKQSQLSAAVHQREEQLKPGTCIVQYLASGNRA